MNWGDYQKVIKDSRKEFNRTTGDHQMEILHDHDLYRHLRFREPDSIHYWYDLVTWPGYLAITGDMGSYTFTRLEDMFTFFRNEQSINPGYWAEKVVAGRDQVDCYIPALHAKHIREYLDDWDDLPKGVREQVEEEIIDDDRFQDEQLARAMIYDFHFWADETKRYTSAPDFEFVDCWDWRVREWHPHFLWCCHAIAAGIKEYDQVTKC